MKTKFFIFHQKATLGNVKNTNTVFESGIDNNKFKMWFPEVPFSNWFVIKILLYFLSTLLKITLYLYKKIINFNNALSSNAVLRLFNIFSQYAYSKRRSRKTSFKKWFHYIIPMALCIPFCMVLVCDYFTFLLFSK